MAANLGLNEDVVRKFSLTRFRESMRDVVDDELQEEMPNIIENVLENPSGTYKRTTHQQSLLLNDISKTTKSIKDDTSYIRKQVDDIQKKNLDNRGFFSDLLGFLFPMVAGVASIAAARRLLQTGRANERAKVATKRELTRAERASADRYTKRAEERKRNVVAANENRKPSGAVEGESERFKKSPIITAETAVERLGGEIAARSVEAEAASLSADKRVTEILPHVTKPVANDNVPKRPVTKTYTPKIEDLSPAAGRAAGRAAGELSKEAVESRVRTAFKNPTKYMAKVIKLTTSKIAARATGVGFWLAAGISVGLAGWRASHGDWKGVAGEAGAFSLSIFPITAPAGFAVDIGLIYRDMYMLVYEIDPLNDPLFDKRYQLVFDAVMIMLKEEIKKNNFNDPDTRKEATQLVKELINRYDIKTVSQRDTSSIDPTQKGSDYTYSKLYHLMMKLGPKNFGFEKAKNSLGGGRGVLIRVNTNDLRYAPLSNKKIANLLQTTPSQTSFDTMTATQVSYNPDQSGGDFTAMPSFGDIPAIVRPGRGTSGGNVDVSRLPTYVPGSSRNQRGEGLVPDTGTNAEYQGATAEKARKNAEAYLGRDISDKEWDMLLRATFGEASNKSQVEQSMIMASILNRARNQGKSIDAVLTAKNQFQAVTGTRQKPGPNANYRSGPSGKNLDSILGSTNFLKEDIISHEQENFTAASSAAYGPGTNIGYRDNMIAKGGKVQGGSVFNTTPNIPESMQGQQQSIQQTPSNARNRIDIQNSPEIENRVQQGQQNVAGIRKGDLAPELVKRYNSALTDLAKDGYDVTIESTSGGQRMKGAHGHTGSHRHDSGFASDFNAYYTDPNTGKRRKLDPRKKDDQPIVAAMLQKMSYHGIMGGGLLYMNDPTKIHLGMGQKSGPDGDRTFGLYTAPAWARQAFNEGREMRLNSLKQGIDPSQQLYEQLQQAAAIKQGETLKRAEGENQDSQLGPRAQDTSTIDRITVLENQIEEMRQANDKRDDKPTEPPREKPSEPRFIDDDITISSAQRNVLAETRGKEDPYIYTLVA